MVIFSADVLLETAMLKLLEAVSAGLLASVTCTVNVFAPAAVGVPLMSPDDAFSASPTGKVPDVTDQWYGAAPPVAASPCE